ncbi:Hypothetical predicted protein [Podarcis lilfordi]|uniref:Uncharacterized protein n=1 Tax=Podarcis lilfordi TaxID=74358 RepID=A0AA35JUG3_9SAUR|nr:Hypothetical predicted protein [Podarcis lilfordi]
MPRRPLARRGRIRRSCGMRVARVGMRSYGPSNENDPAEAPPSLVRHHLRAETPPTSHAPVLLLSKAANPQRALI